jgi:imidazolonepropionase-like amidohydrolase
MNPGSTSIADQLRALTAAKRPIWLQVGRVFCGHDAGVIRHGHVVFQGHQILHAAAESPAAEIVAAEQTEPDLILPEHTILPGLTDAHTHLFLEGGEKDPTARSVHLKKSPAEQLATAEQRLARLVALGITAVREAGDKANVGLDLQARYRSADRGIMPYVDAPGAAINHQKRYGSFMARPMEEHGTPAATVAERVAAGAHRIKLLATGIINFEKGAVTAKPQMPLAELREFVAAARAQGQQTMVHCSGSDGVDNCLGAQVDTVEHGYFITGEQLARIRDLDMVWVPTFAPVQFQHDEPQHIGWSEEVCVNLQRISDGHARSLQRAIELGVRVVAGSDAGSHGVAHGWGFIRELELMQAAGISAPQVLHTATGAGVTRMGYAETFGVLAPQAAARFILTDRDVLSSVSHLREAKIVVYDEHVLDQNDDETSAGL